MNKTFHGKLGEYKWVTTEDGHKTLYSAFYDENCHSTSGAYEETLYNFIHGCNIEGRLLNQLNLNILEVGFGAGLGLKATLDSWNKVYENEIKAKNVNFVSLEIDPDLVKYYFNTYNIDFEILDFLQGNGHIFKSKLIHPNKKSFFNIEIYCADARQILLDKNFIQNYSFDCIFQDPFSPKKNQTLWTQQWFEQLHAVSSSQVILSTYSASIRARKALTKAGWTVYNRKGFGRKRSSTIATVAPLSALLTEKLNIKKTDKTNQEVVRSKAIAYNDHN